jgi:hypothetical protein
MISHILTVGIIVSLVMATSMIIFPPIPSSFTIFVGNGADGRNAPPTISGENIYVTWRERNNMADEHVMRISDDGGATFGPMLQLSQNGTSGNSAGE